MQFVDDSIERFRESVPRWLTCNNGAGAGQQRLPQFFQRHRRFQVDVSNAVSVLNLSKEQIKKKNQSQNQRKVNENFFSPF
jgi:hypothetical protein